MTDITVPHAKRYNRVVWTVPACTDPDELDRMAQTCWQKVADNRFGTLIIRALGSKFEFDLTLSEVGEEVM